MFCKINFVRLILKTGRGGSGFLIKNRVFLKNKLSRGGYSGNIWFFFDKFLKNINYYYFKNNFISYNGFNAKSFYKNGKNGKNLLLRIPLKSIIIDILNKKIIKFKNFKKILILEKSHGGKSCFLKTKNSYFGSSGFSKSVILIIKNFVNFLFIGNFNSGKSSFFMNFFKIKKNNISFYNFSTKKTFLFFFRINKNIYKILDDFNLLFKINLYSESIDVTRFIIIKNLICFIEIFDFYKIFFDFKILNFKIYIFNKIIFYKPKYLLFNKIDLLKKKNFIWFIKNFNFKYIFNWNYILFFNTIFIKNNFLKIIKNFEK